MKFYEKISLFFLVFIFIFFIRLKTAIPTFAFAIPLLIVFNTKFLFHSKPRKDILLVAGLFILEAIISYLVSTLHQSTEIYFAAFWGLRLAFLAFCYFLCKKYSAIEVGEKLIKTLAMCFVLHTAITWLLFFTPQYQKTILSQQHLSSIANNAISNADFTARLPSLGMMFFGGGVYYACMISILIIYGALKTDKYWPWILSGVLLVTGVGIARTAVVGPLVAFVFILNSNLLSNLKKISVFALTILIFFGALTQFEKTKPLTQFVLEPVLHLSEKGQVATTSTDALIATVQNSAPMLTYNDVWKQGTGKVFSQDGYFGGSDVGYIRLTFYGGYLYTLLFFLPALLILYLSVRATGFGMHSKIIAAIVAIQFICNLKGVIELSAFLILFLLSALSTKKPNEIT